MLEITNNRSTGKNADQTPKKNPSRSALPPVKVSVDYRELSHRRISTIRPKTASPVVRAVGRENSLKFKKSNTLSVNGIGALLHEDSVHLGGSVFSEKSTYKLRHKLSYMCHDIEGTKSRDAEGTLYGSDSRDELQQGSSVIEDIEQRLPFTNNSIEEDRKENGFSHHEIKYDDVLNESEGEGEAEGGRANSPTGNDPNRFFIDLWLKKYQQPADDQSIQNSASVPSNQQPQVDTFYMDLLCRLQNAFTKAKYTKHQRKKVPSQREDPMNSTEVGTSIERDRRNRQLESMKMIAVAALDIFDILIQEKGPATMILPAIKDALLPLIFDQSELSLEHNTLESKYQRDFDFNNDGASLPSTSTVPSLPIISPPPLDYTQFSTYLERYVDINHYHSQLTSKYEKLLKDYLSMEILKDDYLKQSQKYQQKSQLLSEQLQTLSTKHQELRLLYETDETRIKELESLYKTEQEKSHNLQEKVSHFESEYHLLKIEQSNVRKERAKFESEWSSLLIENDKLRKENDGAVKLKFEFKRQLSELSEKYQSLLSKLKALQQTFHNKYEDELLGKVNTLMNSIWIDFHDDEYETIQHQLQPVPIIASEDNVDDSDSFSHLSSVIATKRASIVPPRKVAVGIDQHRKSLMSVVPAFVKSKSINTIIRNIDENINSEAQEIETFAEQLEDDFTVFQDAFKHIEGQIQHCHVVEEQYQKRLHELYQDRQRLISLHHQQMIEMQQNHREEQRKFNKSNQEVQETLRKTIHQKEMDIATYQEVRRQHERQIERLTEDIVKLETKFDHILEERNMFESNIMMMRSDTFFKRQEKTYEETIKEVNKQLKKVLEELDDVKKELSLQVKETHRIRETSDHQIYLLMKEKDKLNKEKTEKQRQIDEVIQKSYEEASLASERIMMTTNEVQSWQIVASDLHVALQKPVGIDEEIQTMVVERKDFDQQVTNDMLPLGHSSPNSKKGRRKKNREGTIRKSSQSKKSRSRLLSMHSISEEGEEDDDAVESPSPSNPSSRRSSEASSVDSDSDLSDSENEDESDSGSSSSASSDEGETSSRKKRKKAEKKNRKSEKKLAKKEKRLQKLRQQLNQRRVSSVTLDPRLFAEERKKSILRASVKNSILFDREYIPVEANNFYENPEVVKEFVASLKICLNQFQQVKEELNQEKMKIQNELIEFQAVFFQEKGAILKELQKKIHKMNQVTIAEILNHELQKVILTEQHSISPELIPTDVKEFKDHLQESFSKSLGDDSRDAANIGRKISFQSAPSSSTSFVRQSSASLPLTTDEAIPEDTALGTPFRTTTRESIMASPGDLVKMLSKRGLTRGAIEATSIRSSLQTKSDDQVDKIIDIKALIKLSKKLGHFVFKKRQKSLGSAGQRTSVASIADSSLIIDSSDEEEDELAQGEDEENLDVDGFESMDTLQEMKKQKRKRKTLKPKILIEIDPAAQVKMDKKSKLRQHSHDRFYHVSTQTVEDTFSWSNRMTPANTATSPLQKKKGVITNSFLIKSLAHRPSSANEKGSGQSPTLSDREDEEEDEERSDGIHQSRRTVDTRENTGGSKLSRRLKSDTIFSDLLTKYYNKEQISQPFLGFIRKHEKIYAREIGLMKIAMREYKRYYDMLRTDIQHLLSLNGSNKSIVTILSHLQQSMETNQWMFDPELFIRKVNNNPLEDCIDVSTQLRIIESYQDLLANRLIMNQENQSLIKLQNQHLLDAANHLTAALNAREDQLLHRRSPSPPTSSTILEEEGEEEKDESMTELVSTDAISSTHSLSSSQNHQIPKKVNSRRKSKLEVLTERRASLIQEYTHHRDSANTSDQPRHQQQQQETLYHLINHTIKDLLVDITERMKRSGGWKALLYRSDGSVDVNMTYEHFPLEEQIIIQTEKVNYLLVKLDQKQENHEKIIQKLNKQNSELINKVASLQKQIQQLQLQAQNQQQSHGRLLTRAPSFTFNDRAMSSKLSKEIAINTDVSFFNQDRKGLKEITNQQWTVVLDHISSIAQRVQVASKQIEQERQAMHQLQSVSNLQRASIVRPRRLSNPENNLLKKVFEKDSTVKAPLFMSDDGDEEEEGLNANSCVSDEDLSRYSKEIINDYRISSSPPPGRSSVVTSQEKRMTGSLDVKEKANIQLYSTSEKMAGSLQPLRAQSAGKRLNIVNNNKTPLVNDQRNLEYLSITGPKPFSSKLQLGGIQGKVRPWSSTTWRQIEKNSKDLFLQNQPPHGRKSPVQSNTREASLSPSKFTMDHEIEQEDDTKDILRQLLTISETLDKVLCSSVDVTSHKVEESPETRKLKTLSFNDSSEFYTASRRDTRESHAIDLQSEAINNSLSQISKSWVFEESGDQEQEGRERIEDPSSSSIYLPQLNAQLSSDVIFGVGESALEEKTSRDVLDIAETQQPALLLKDAASTDTMTVTDSVSQPPLLRSVTFRAPSFHQKDITTPTDREGIYTKLYQQMFAALEGQSEKKEKVLPSSSFSPVKLPIKVKSSDIPKSTISPEITLYVSALQEKYLQHKQESDKLMQLMSSLEKSYHGLDLFSAKSQSTGERKFDSERSKVTTSTAEQQDALDYYKHPIRKEPLIRPQQQQQSHDK